MQLSKMPTASHTTSGSKGTEPCCEAATSWPGRGGPGRIADDQQLVILDGPFADTKEALGGVIVLEAESFEAACEIARTWPSLRIYPGAKVEVVPVSEALGG